MKVMNKQVCYIFIFIFSIVTSFVNSPCYSQQGDSKTVGHKDFFRSQAQKEMSIASEGPKAEKRNKVSIK